MGWASYCEDIRDSVQEGLDAIESLRERLAENVDHLERREPLPSAKRTTKGGESHPLRAVSRVELSEALQKVSASLAKAKEVMAQFDGDLKIATDPQIDMAAEVSRLREELRSKTAQAEELLGKLKVCEINRKQIKVQRRVEVKKLIDEIDQLRKNSPIKGKPQRNGGRN